MAIPNAVTHITGQISLASIAPQALRVAGKPLEKASDYSARRMNECDRASCTARPNTTICAIRRGPMPSAARPQGRAWVNSSATADADELAHAAQLPTAQIPISGARQ
jgi:hypothetical protein